MAADRGFIPGLFLATVLAGALRFASLGEIPIAVYCDEAFFGYEAFSLVETGRDSRGVAWPFFFDIFGEGWAEPLYVYLTLPWVAILGLTTVATRLAAALAGTLAVPITGVMTAALLRADLVPGDRRREAVPFQAGIAAAFLMAISPWAFHFSRIAFQAGLLPFTLAAGIWLAAEGLGRRDGGVRTWVLAAGAGVLALSLYTYTASRAAVPLLAAGFAWCFRRKLLSAPKASILAVILLVLVALPIASFSFTEQGRQRIGNVTILNRGSLDEIVPWLVGNYLSYYSPAFLLTQGDPNPRHSIRNHGMLHPHDAVFLVVGAAVSLAVRSRGMLFLLWWLATFPAAAALTIDQRHAIRSIAGQPAIYALGGIGVAFLLTVRASALPGIRSRKALLRVLTAAILAGVAVPSARYFRHYFTEYPVYSAPAWQYGLKDVFGFLESSSISDDKVYIQKMTDQPQSHLLFYFSFPPREYQEHGLSRTRYVFDYAGGRIPRQRLPVFVTRPNPVIPDGLEVRKVFKYPDGSDAWVIVW